MLEAVLIIAVVAVAVLVWARRGPGRSGQQNAAQKRLARARARAAKTAAQGSGPYRAITIDGNCPAVTALQGQRFLTADAPRLPLPDCDQGNCQCTYVHHEDRRDIDGDRRVPRGLKSDLYTTSGKQERRERSRGRRKSDLA